MGVIGQAHQPGFYPVSSVDGIFAGQPLHYYRQLGSYTAYWEVQQSHLYLHHLEVCVYDKQKKEEYSLTYQPDQLKKVFQPYYQNGKICARWFNGELRAGKGELVRYVHSGFDRNLETEQVMVLQHGRIESCQTYHNTTGWHENTACSG